jgi:hypothetical protein
MLLNSINLHGIMKVVGVKGEDREPMAGGGSSRSIQKKR